MARVLSFGSSFFSATFVILLVLGLLALGNPVVADEPLSPNNNQMEACGNPDDPNGCGSGDGNCGGAPRAAVFATTGPRSSTTACVSMSA